MFLMLETYIVLTSIPGTIWLRAQPNSSETTLRLGNPPIDASKKCVFQILISLSLFVRLCLL